MRGKMAFEEMHRRQRDIAARRRKKKKKFSLLLSHISVPTSHSYKNTNDRSFRAKFFMAVAPFVVVMFFLFDKRAAKPGPPDHATVRNKYWKAHVVEEKPLDEVTANERGELLEKLAGRGNKPFNYIGDLDPGKPKPWPKEEKDWWALHDKLVQSVKKSDERDPLEFNVDESRLPQLVFFGDSITEGWRGQSFGRVPGKHRMWREGEDEEIREVFRENFGKESKWGRRALKPPLVLGIAGSRTYDFIWRIENGEFPTSKLLDHHEEEGDDEQEGKKDASKTFQLDRLERIYIVLMGTNNIGGGMLPEPTVKGMDAVGRRILQLHEEIFPNNPAAMLFSELLPRRDDFRVARMCPPRCKNLTTEEPYDSFMPAIDKVNRALPEVVEGWRSDFPSSRVVLLSQSPKASQHRHAKIDGKSEEEAAEPNDYKHTIECGMEMFGMDDEDKFDEYMPDRLHPNAKGYELWSRCLKRGLEVIMDHVIHLRET